MTLLLNYAGGRYIMDYIQYHLIFFLLMIPLGIWKLIEIIIWVVKHVRVVVI